ncbi:MAG: radical SAM protein [Anaerolineales bacterium]|nr:radical SAM protein [Anaerolineales bacterium]
MTNAQMRLLDNFKQPRKLQRRFVSLALDDLIEKGLIRPVAERVELLAQRPSILTAWLHLTNACNLRCAYCYIYKTPSKMELTRGKQAVDAVFRSAIAQGFSGIKLKYAGGEPTLNFELVLTLHCYAQELANKNELSLDGVLLSNGVGLTDRMIEDLQNYGIRLMVSLDGLDDFHDGQLPFINGKGSFTKVMDSLDKLAKYSLVPSISITVSSLNLQGLPTLVELLLARQLPFSINFFRDNNCTQTFGDLAFQEAEIISAMRAAFTAIERNLPPYSLLGSLLDRTRLDSPHNRTCGVGNSYLVIDQHGAVAKCHMQIEQTITDVDTADPLALINTDSIGIQNLPVTEKEGCRDCTWRYYCAGGCPALTYRATGRYDVKSPNCNIYKALFPDLIRLEGLRLLKYGSEFNPQPHESDCACDDCACG